MPNDYLSLVQAGNPAAANPYLDMMQAERDGQEAAFRASATQALGVDPDAAARARRVAGYLGTTTPAVQALPADAERAAKLKALSDNTAQTPTLRSRYTDADFAALAHDDSGPLSAIESAVRWLVSAPGAARGGLAGDAGTAGNVLRAAVPGFAGKAYGALAAPFGLADQAIQAMDDAAAALTGTKRRQIVGTPGPEGFLLNEQKAANQQAQALMPDMTGWSPEARGLVSGLRSGAENLMTLPLWLVGGEAAMLGTMGGITFGDTYGKGREAGQSPLPAFAYGAQDATAEVITEKFLGAAGLLKNIKAGASAGKLFIYELLKEVPGEIAATVWQNFNEWTNLHPEKSVGDFILEQPDAIRETIVATLVGGGVQIGTVKGVERAMGAGKQQEQQAQQAERAGQALAELATLAEASKLRERAPDQFATFAQSLADERVPNLYVDAKALAESGVDLQQLGQALPSVAAQFDQALATGGDVVIPTGEFLTGGQEFAQPLLEHARTGSDAMSPAEAKVYMQEHGDALQAEIAKVLTEKQGDEAFNASRDEVAAGFVQQLQAAGRTPDVAKAEGAALGSFFAVQAARLGITPAEMAARYPLRVQGTVAEGAAQYDQPGNPKFDAWFGDSKVVDAKGKPLVVYHGTQDSIEVFEPGWKQLERGATPAELRSGSIAEIYRRLKEDPEIHFFAEEQATAGSYGPEVMQVYLSIRNPVYAEDRDEAIQRMLDEGADGARFPDTTSSGRHGGYAWVVRDSRQIKSAIGNNGNYDPTNPSILEQQARGQIALGADITQQPSIITLLQGADLSTAVHEMGHFYLEVLTDLAARIEGQQRDGASLEPGEAEILADAQKLLAWFGIKDTPEQSALSQWFAMTTDEKRVHHEAFARGFEAYAFEGKAPSVELQGPFQKFRAWMLSVYKQLKALNVTLTDEVRGVMDRMLATTEQIQTAEAARSMGALFQTAEQAGMTPEQWAAYQGLALDATQTAIDNLQAKGLKDMQWLQNARSRKLKELQRRADGLRREVRQEARADVMSQPVYRAWQFLTGKGADIDTAKPDPKQLDTGGDSLLVAIAKMGGINRESAQRDAGVHPDYHRTESGVFGKPVFRKEGGHTADHMVQMLADAGYLQTDEHGRSTLRDLEEAIDSELHGSPVYSNWHDYAADMEAKRLAEAPAQPLPDNVLFGKLSTGILKDRYGNKTDAIWRKLSALRMTSEANGIDPDVVAETFGFQSGDEMVQALAVAQPPKEAVEALTDQRMLERFGDLATPEGLQRATDEALHGDARSRFIATELQALRDATSVREKVPGQKRSTVDVMKREARAIAQGIVARLKVRDLRPGQYLASEARSARAAAKAAKAGDLKAAAQAKQAQLIQSEAAKAALDAQTEMEKAAAYFRKFDKRQKSIAVDYQDQIEQLLVSFSFRSADSLRAIDKRRSLAEWIEAQREQGIEPEIPEAIEQAAALQSYKDMTVEQVRGLRDTIEQIEHLGRLKNKLLTAKAVRDFEAARDQIVASIDEHAGDRQADTRTPSTKAGRWLQAVKKFGAAHIKVAGWARILDGGKDAGPVWEFFVRSANERGDMETTMRGHATEALVGIMAPLMKSAKLGGKGQHFPSIGRSMNREQVLAMALNMGNAGNIQRMLGGEGWTLAQIQPVLSTLSASDWQAVQAVWDHFESYRPLIAAKERRVYGKEPNWVDPQPLQIHTADNQTITLRGGYYPIKYDPLANNRAEQHSDAESAKRQLQGAYTSATTRRGFTKARASEISGRPLLYSLQGVYSGVNDVIHDLAWHEWLIDVNKLLRSDKIDAAIRDHYGPEVVRQFKSWVQDIAEGDKGFQNALEAGLARVRQGVSVAGLGFNVMIAAMQPLGLTQSIVRVGAAHIARGVAQYIAHPIQSTRQVNAASEFMASRARTRFRELAELRNQVEGQSAAKEWMGRYAYMLMMRFQQAVDVPTWLGAYEKALGEGNEDARAKALADQAVIDAQGGGATKDLSAIERGSPALKLFTVFYSFMNTALNLGYTQAATSEKTAKGRAKLAADMVLLYSVPAVLGALLKDALTPGDPGDDDEKTIKKLLAAQLDYLLGLFALVREFTSAGKAVAGLDDHVRDYGGPAGLRVMGDTVQFAKQAHQGEFDDAFRKSFLNLLGGVFGLPTAQANRTVTGAQALSEGKTQNPAALVFGFQEPR